MLHLFDILDNFDFEVDFDDEMLQIIAETKFLQTLGRPVPNLQCCVAMRVSLSIPLQSHFNI